MQNILSRIIKSSIYLMVFLVPLFFLPFSFEGLEYNKQYLIFFLTGIAFFAWLAKMAIADKEIRFKHSILDLFVLVFLVISVISSIFSIDKMSSLFGFYGRFSDGLLGLISMAALYFLVTNNLVAEDMKKVKKLFLCSTALVVVIAYFSVFGVWGKIPFLAGQAALSSVFNTTSASLEGLAMFLAIALVFLAAKKGHKSVALKYVLLVAVLGLLVIIDFTPAWITILATLILFVGLSLWKRIFKENVNLLLVPIAIIIVAAVCLPFQFTSLIFGANSKIATLPQEQTLDQANSWKVGVNTATDNVKNIFVGSGPGTYYYDFAQQKPKEINNTTWLWQIRFDRAGSYVSEVLATMGFAGLISYLALIAIFLMISWFMISKQTGSLLFTVVFLSLVIGQFFYYQNTTLAFLFWLIMGLAVVKWQGPVKEKSISFKEFPEISLVFSTLVIVVGLGILALDFFGVKYYLADVNYAKAQAMNSSVARNQLLEKAAIGNLGLSQYRMALSRGYLSEALNEMAKPAAQQDTNTIQQLVASAIDQAKVSTTLTPKSVASWENLGVIYREIKDMASGALDWGVKAFETAITLEPTNPVIYTELGKLYANANNNEKATESFQRALEQKPDYVNAMVQEALLLEKEGKASEAITKLETLFPTYYLNTELLFQLGRLYFNAGQADKAVIQFQNVILLSPNHSNAHYSLAIVYASQGKKDLAIQEFEKVLELNPGNEDVAQKIAALKE
jgi:tetratricopeptide (TPR) repeat protein